MYHLPCLCLLSAAIGAHAASIPRPANEDDPEGDQSRFFGGPPPAYGGPPHSIPFPAGSGGYPANYGGQDNISSGSSYTNTGINTPHGTIHVQLIK